MTPTAAIAMLDRQIHDHGEDVQLRAQSAPTDGTADVAVRAFVRGFQPEELASGVQQNDSKAILSPSSLAGTAFADGFKRLAVMVINGRARRVENVDPIRIAGVVVRIEAWVKG